MIERGPSPSRTAIAPLSPLGRSALQRSQTALTFITASCQPKIRAARGAVGVLVGVGAVRRAAGSSPRAVRAMLALSVTMS